MTVKVIGDPTQCLPYCTKCDNARITGVPTVIRNKRAKQLTRQQSAEHNTCTETSAATWRIRINCCCPTENALRGKNEAKSGKGIRITTKI